MKKLNLKKLVNSSIQVPDIVGVNLSQNEGGELNRKLNEEWSNTLNKFEPMDFINYNIDKSIVLNLCESLLEQNGIIFFKLGLIEVDFDFTPTLYYLAGKELQLESTELNLSENGGYGLFVHKSENNDLVYDYGYYEDFPTFGCEYHEFGLEQDPLADIIHEAIDSDDIWEE